MTTQKRPERPQKGRKSFSKSGKVRNEKPGSSRQNKSDKPEKKKLKPEKASVGIRLNKYLADAGIASRRAADKLIEGGAVTINGEVVTQLGTKVMPGDKVQFGGQTLKQEKPRYLLLNKPKGFLTTSDDPFNRRTVMSLVEKACSERIYPVGRLDRNTMGLLLFTNDGELAKKLMHPKFNVKKIYHVFLDKNLSKNDMISIMKGVDLEDGKIIPDSIAYVAGAEDKKQIGIELHSGKNRVVRRIFEHYGYQVIKLDRVFLAGLTKKDLPRSKWRFLTEKEVNMLKRLG